jgi:hypothetical protein
MSAVQYHPGRRKVRQARALRRLPLREQTRFDARYYIVGENDVWMLQFKDPEHRDVTRRNAAVAFAVGAAQELGMRGQCAHVCVMDDDGRLRRKWTYGREALSRSYAADFGDAVGDL